VDRGEFRQIDMDYAVYIVLAPMMFLMLWKHSMGACVPFARRSLHPEQYIRTQIDNLLHGLCVRPAASPPPPSQTHETLDHLDGAIGCVVLVGGACGARWPRGKAQQKALAEASRTSRSKRPWTWPPGEMITVQRAHLRWACPSRARCAP
jgi:hypothetical protein